MRRTISSKIAGGFLGALLVALPGAYFHYDTETENITDAVREKSGGSFIVLPQGAVHYQLGGPVDGPTVVLVHGFSVPYYIWDPTFDALTKAGFRVLRYDLYGRGFSDRPAVRYDTNFYDQQLSGLLDALKITGAVDLAGLSMGGPIVATFASRHPERVRSLVFVDPAYSTGREPPFSVRAPRVGEYYMTVFIAPSLAESQLEDFYRPEKFPDWPDKYRVQMRYKGFRRALLSTMRDFSGRDVSSDYARAGQGGRPVLLIWGEADQTVPLKVSEQLRKAIPQAELHIIKEAAHLPQYERPEVVNPILIDFLKRQAAPRP
jgi:pimeloyl-ACP methyl ester carboxylesterase